MAAVPIRVLEGRTYKIVAGQGGGLEDVDPNCKTKLEDSIHLHRQCYPVDKSGEGLWV